MISAAMCVVDGWAVGGMHRARSVMEIVATVMMSLIQFSFIIIHFSPLKIMYDSPKEAEK